MNDFKYLSGRMKLRDRLFFFFFFFFFLFLQLLIEWGCDLSIKNANDQSVIESAKTLDLKQFITSKISLHFF